MNIKKGIICSVKIYCKPKNMKKLANPPAPAKNLGDFSLNLSKIFLNIEIAMLCYVSL